MVIVINDDRPMWVKLTNSEQFYFYNVHLELINDDWLTVCWLFDWTASQLVKFLYLILFNRIYHMELKSDVIYIV